MDGDQLMEALLLLGLEDDAAEHGPPLPPAPHVLDEAAERIQHCMAEIDLLGQSLREKCNEEEIASNDFDQLLFERSAVFKAELVTYLKEYMLTLQVLRVLSDDCIVSYGI